MSSWRPKSTTKVGDEIGVEKQKRSTSLIDQFRKFSTETSLHGIKYINEEGRHWGERVLWVLLCIASVVFGCFIFYPVFERWINFPTITTIFQTNYPISNIPFPAVTICSNNKIIETQLNKILKDSKGA